MRQNEEKEKPSEVCKLRHGGSPAASLVRSDLHSMKFIRPDPGTF